MTIDPEITRFLEKLDKEGHLENTIVRIFSDHGDHVNPIGYETVSGISERYNPFMFTMIPESWEPKMGKNLEANVQKLVVAYDFFVSDMAVLREQSPFKYG